MSDQIDRLVLGSWTASTASTAFQAGSAVYLGWNARQQWRKKKTTDYERVFKGETKNGWRKAMDFGTKVPSSYYPVFPRLFNEEDPMQDGDHVVLALWYPQPNGRKVMCVRQFSMIRSTQSTLMKVMWDPDEYWHGLSLYLTPRIILNTFGRLNSTEYRILLLDTRNGKIRSFVISTPKENMDSLFAYIDAMSPPNIHMVFQDQSMEEDQQHLEIFDVKYRLDESAQPIAPHSWESISVPINDRGLDFECYLGQCYLYLLLDRSNNATNDTHQCITFDYAGTWRLQSLSEWLLSFQESKMGARIVEAARSFESLSPPNIWKLKVPLVRYLEFAYPIGNRFMCFTAKGAYGLHRWIGPPTLRQLAMQAIFRAIPDLKMADLKAALGFDLWEGTSGEDEDEEGNGAEIVSL